MAIKSQKVIERHGIGYGTLYGADSLRYLFSHLIGHGIEPVSVNGTFLIQGNGEIDRFLERYSPNMGIDDIANGNAHLGDHSVAAVVHTHRLNPDEGLKSLSRIRGYGLDAVLEKIEPEFIAADLDHENLRLVESAVKKKHGNSFMEGYRNGKLHNDPFAHIAAANYYMQMAKQFSREWDYWESLSIAALGRFLTQHGYVAAHKRIEHHTKMLGTLTGGEK